MMQFKRMHSLAYIAMIFQRGGGGGGGHREISENSGMKTAFACTLNAITRG